MAIRPDYHSAMEKAKIKALSATSEKTFGTSYN
jgi:hypothetical protein